MQYTYNSPLKGGKFLIRSLFQYNQKSYALTNSGYEKFCYRTYPTVDGYHANQWYWECKYTRKIRTWYELRHLTTQQEVLRQTMETVCPFGDTRRWNGYDKSTGKHYPLHSVVEGSTELYKTFPEIYKSDIIVNPITTLGYTAGICSKEMNWNLRRGTPNLKVDINYSVNELKKRCNIVTYKGDIYDYIKNHFFAGAMPLLQKKEGEGQYVKYCSNLIKECAIYMKLLRKLLESYKIDYEMYDLDSDKYCETFNLEKGLDRSLWKSDTRFYKLPKKYLPKLNQWTENFIKNNSSYLTMLGK